MDIGIPDGHPFFGERGALLGTRIILDLLEDGWLFESGTWKEERLRPAAYDLVIASDDLRIPDPNNRKATLEYPPGEHMTAGGFTLSPGDFAFVTTEERLCLPWTIAGNIGVRNRFARRGLLILTGLVVDPGYGLEPEDQEWRRKPDRLHFGVANVGRGPLTIVPGKDAIATIQFLPVEGEVSLKHIDAPKTGDPVAEGFLLFTDLERDISQVEERIDRTEASVSTTVVFGLFVILATFFGAISAVVLGAVSNETISDVLGSLLLTVREHLLASILVALVFFSLAVILAGLALVPIARMMRGARVPRSRGLGRRRKDAKPGRSGPTEVGPRSS